MKRERRGKGERGEEKVERQKRIEVERRGKWGENKQRERGEREEGKRGN